MIIRSRSLEFSFTARMTIALAIFLGLSILVLRVDRQLVSMTQSTMGIAKVLGIYSRHDARLRLVRVRIAQLADDPLADPTKRQARWASLNQALVGWSHRRALPLLNMPGRTGILQRRAYHAERRFSAAAMAMSRRDSAASPARMKRFRTALWRMERRSDPFRHALRTQLDQEVRRTGALAERAFAQMVLAVGLMLVLGALLVLWLRLRIVRPLMRIVRTVRAMNAGQKPPLLCSGARPDELGELTRALQSMARATEEREQAQREVEYLAHHDPLTGLANRVVFAERLAEALGRGARIALLAIDLDGFKCVNDTLGHAMGDTMLKRATALLTASVCDGDIVARIGGDEFAILHHLSPDENDAAALARRIFTVVAADPAMPAIRLSIGIALSPRHGVEGGELHACADIALYRAKAEGRHCARHYDRAMDEEQRQRHWLAHELRGAVERGDLYLMYQPLADCATRRIIGYEALARWHHPVLGPVSPDCFIALAEENGLIDEIGQRLLVAALTEARGWPADRLLAINLSPVQLRDPMLAEQMLAVITAHGMDPRRVEVEVTEGVLIDHREIATANLAGLRAAGVGIVMDDFGTGYSSLSSLQQFPFDKIKIDRSFIQAMDADGPALSIVRASIGLGRSLNIPIIAEGVETDAQHRMLCDLGCDQIQGYLIGRPAVHLAHAA
ncbi:putative bifunctional diguanylate cyclase/phosphodiesterase [Sphingomonas fuzhouensis]|uniref:putative bifunctional diguanylate cyclase/phosphodiesterase n=1 Tax=Sphingomonas fuzhouensis TaxID=3106033 RepID=UPI002AFFD141|nr:EAL domain-containing protein [Sphingomonas sp. SGZ-02]